MSLACHGLSIGHGSRTLCSDIDMALSGGDIVCLLGANGCGKTTLFKTLLGLMPPLAGEIQLCGQALSTLGRAQIARSLAYVPQQHAPPFPYSVAEVVLMARAAHLPVFAQPGKADYLAVNDALLQLGIGDLKHHDYSRLSGGQRQLVLIARALAQKTPFIILDEPTASLDFGNEAIVLNQVQALGRQAADQNRGIILSTHDPDQAFALDARVLLMHAGRVIADGAAHSVLTSAALSQAYGTSIAVERTASGRMVCLPG